MTDYNAAKSGTFKIGGDLEVNRLGFGAMRITGDGIWGNPADHDESIRTLKRLPELGVNFIDTADSYGPDVSEWLIKEALHPYKKGLVVATKGGLTRHGPNIWLPLGRPEYLIQQVHKSLRNLGVEQIDLWQLHRIDPKVPAKEQFDAIKSLLDSGLIRHAGLSEVSVADIEAASKVFKVATVQNRYNLVDRTAKMCSTIAPSIISASSPGTRWQPAISPSPAHCSIRLPKNTMLPRARLRWTGC